MPEPLQFPGSQQPSPEIDTNDPIVEFITGLLQILEGRNAASWDALQADIRTLLDRRPPLPVPAGQSPEEFAQSLADAAFESEEGAALAIEALRIDHTTPDAWSYLADDCGQEFELAVMLYTLGLMTAQERLGQDAAEEYAGRFWEAEETQPFMRALEGLASSCQGLGDLSAAASHYSLMIELDPHDHLGARYPLVAILLLANQQDAAGQLLHIYDEDKSPPMTWARALQKYLELGASSEADTALRAALKSDPAVAGYLTGERQIPEFAPESAMELETLTTAMLLREAWLEAPKAVEWLTLVAAAGPSLVIQDDAPAATPTLIVPPSKAKRDGPRGLD